MKKLIFINFFKDLAAFFLGSLFIIGFIVWTIQAINYFEFVTEDGHGLKIYFTYTFLSLPKLLSRILPFVFFVSVFYTLVSYELRNELSIFWINGISRLNFLNMMVLFSILIIFIQLILSTLIAPVTQFEARKYIKNSNIDFFSSLIKPGKFINVAKNLTIFIEKQNEDYSYTNIFIEDKRNNQTKMIYAKKGFLVQNVNERQLEILNGQIINNDETKINILDFNQINFDLKNIDTITITVPKIQEIDTKTLLSCITVSQGNKYDAFECSESLLKEIKQELLKRLVKPFYIIIITLFSAFLLFNSKNKLNFKKNNNLIFCSTLIVVIFSEASLRYSTKFDIMIVAYSIIPFFAFMTGYYFFYKFSKNV